MFMVFMKDGLAIDLTLDLDKILKDVPYDQKRKYLASQKNELLIFITIAVRVLLFLIESGLPIQYVYGMLGSVKVEPEPAADIESKPESDIEPDSYNLDAFKDFINTLDLDEEDNTE